MPGGRAAGALEGDDARLLESLDRLSAVLGVRDDSLGRTPFPPPYPEPRFTPLAVCEILRRDCVSSLVGKLKRPWVVKGGTPQLPAGPSYTTSRMSTSASCFSCGR